MNAIVKKLMNRWEVETVWQVAVILLIFAITGMSALFVKQLAFGWIGIVDSTPWWIRVSCWFAFVLPSYQVLFLFYGFLLGQFDFVWRFEKNSFNRIKNLILPD
ncbi:MAG TPA: DUF6787 family protein [Balneolaceae bacterium]|nr:DUF6787 family protein [Balneolaceae bacterium]